MNRQIATEKVIKTKNKAFSTLTFLKGREQFCGTSLKFKSNSKKNGTKKY